MPLTAETPDLDLSLLSEIGCKHYAKMQSLLQREEGKEHASKHLSASCPRNASSNEIRMTSEIHYPSRPPTDTYVPWWRRRRGLGTQPGNAASVSSSVNQGMGGDGPEILTCSDLRGSRGGLLEGAEERLRRDTRKKGGEERRVE